MFLESTPMVIFKRHARLVITAGLVVAVLSLALSFIFPLKYRADAQVLIISQSRYGVDPYTAVKSAEQIGGNIVQIVKTNDFYGKVMNQTGYDLDKSAFANLSEKSKRKLWQKTINTSVIYGTGVLNISAYATDKEQAKALANAVSQTLAMQGWEYVGGDVAIKIVNDAVSTNWPARPNLFLNAFFGFLAGLVGMGYLVYNKYYRK